MPNDEIEIGEDVNVSLAIDDEGNEVVVVDDLIVATSAAGSIVDETIDVLDDDGRLIVEDETVEVYDEDGRLVASSEQITRGQ